MPAPPSNSTPLLEPALLTFVVALMVLFGLYIAWGLARWAAGNRANLTSGQFRRRMAGGILLEIDLLLWFLANPLMQGRPARERLLYLLAATALVFPPMMLAVREAAFIAREYVRMRGDLVRSMGRQPPTPWNGAGENGSAPRES